MSPCAPVQQSDRCAFCARFVHEARISPHLIELVMGWQQPLDARPQEAHDVVPGSHAI